MFQDNTWLYIEKDVFNKVLKKSYTLQNLEKQKLISRKEIYRSKNMPDFHEHYWIQPQWIKIPLGLLGTEWYSKIDRRQKHTTYNNLPFKPTLRDDQLKAVYSLIERPVWLLNAGTGVGKSYMLLYLAAYLQRKTLIIVNSTITLKEMIEKCQEFIGVTPIVVGGTKKIKPTTDQITIALIHSAGKLNLYEYGCILADECDLYVSTPIRQKLWFECSPDYLYGFSATLKVNMQEDRLINLFFWHAETSIKEVNLTPTIKMVPTRYQYPGVLDSDGEFSKMQTDISENTARNELIVNKIYDTLPKTETKKGLLLTKRTEQAHTFVRMLKEKGIEAYTIIWDTPEEERKEIIARTISSPSTCIIVGSAQILGRWFDCPILQAVYIQAPNKFEEALQQVVWRVLRTHKDKTYALVYDFFDGYETPLRRQAEHRRRTYKKKYWVEVKMP